jgi:hypothetical protein
MVCICLHEDVLDIVSDPLANCSGQSMRRDEIILVWQGITHTCDRGSKAAVDCTAGEAARPVFLVSFASFGVLVRDSFEGVFFPGAEEKLLPAMQFVSATAIVVEPWDAIGCG